MTRSASFLFAVLVLASSGACSARPPRAPTVAPAPFGNTEADIHHAIARLSFGERPGDAERIASLGLDRFLREQLDPASADDPSLAAARARFPLAFEAPLAQRFGAADDATESIDGRVSADRRRQVITDARMATLLRQATSERQLDEVLVDFWANHFYVAIEKGPCAFLTASYVETAIRPHIRGQFVDMLLAVAQHPAMLVYLDNAKSSTERPGAQGAHGGLNENYARELLELHTLGVDGGYTQNDVREAARVLTGWGEAELDFSFRAAWHDRGEKVVLGHRFAPGGGIEEGVALLRQLAEHPSTARFVSKKLLVRFVSDAPSDEAIDRLSRVFLETGGDLGAMIRAIVDGPEFWSQEHRHAKVRSGLEYFLALVRASGATIDDARALGALGRLGQMPFGTMVPTGFPETAQSWADPGRMSTRWAIAFQFANGNLPGVSLTRRSDEPADDVALTFAAPEFQAQ